MLKLILIICSLSLLVGCVQKTVKPDDPYYAPVASQNLQRPQPVTGSIVNLAMRRDLYGNGRASQVGDIISITLNESTSASKNAKTTADKSSSTVLTPPTVFGDSWDKLNANITGPTTAFEGEGKSDISNSLNGSISVTVHEVLPNGILVVRGEKWLNLNQGDEYIQISGLVRPQDIAADNTISSEKLADARISYSGTGQVSDTNVMGFMAKFFLSALML
ncbi:MAG: flagellar basal body L-ring protein FlgH [Pseudomonadales bacterium]|nr:flagellar basal body L-ring protein FlgH [Pseudomonadales bacterium]